MTGILALDMGTSGTKAAVLGADGSMRASAFDPYPTAHPAAGAAEQDPAEWLRAARTVIAAVLREAPAHVLSITGQMQDLVVLDAAGSPCGPATLYRDSRSGEQVERLLGADPGWEGRSGNLQDATSIPAQWLRRLEEDPALSARADRILLGPAGFLVHALGLGAWCDPTTASASGMLEAATGRWDAAICAAAGVDLRLLPRLTTGKRHGGALVGRVPAARAARGRTLGLPEGIPVVLALGDAGATTLGAVGLEQGDAYAYLGTSGWLAAVARPGTAPGPTHRLVLPPGADGARELRISAVLAAGAAADWARDAFLGGATTAEADALLEDRRRRGGRGPEGLLVIPSIHGERFPVRDAGLRAAIIGADSATSGIDLYAAVLEGVAHALGHALDGRTGPQSSEAELVLVGGGAASRPLEADHRRCDGSQGQRRPRRGRGAVGRCDRGRGGDRARARVHPCRPAWLGGIGRPGSRPRRLP